MAHYSLQSQSYDQTASRKHHVHSLHEPQNQSPDKGFICSTAHVEIHNVKTVCQN